MDAANVSGQIEPDAKLPLRNGRRQKSGIHSSQQSTCRRYTTQSREKILQAKAHLREDQDGQVIMRFVGWAETTRSALHRGKTVPACSWFVLTSFVRKLCSIHRNRMLACETKEVTSCGNHHHYLYIALRLTYDFRLKHRNLVSMLLREIFLCEGSLKAIFSIMHPLSVKQNVNINTYTLFPRLHQLDRSALDYFIKSLCPLDKDVREKEGIVYTPENVLNKPFDDYATTPLQAAITLGDPTLALLLLRHGADPLLCERGEKVENKFPLKCAVAFAVDRLNILAVFKEPGWEPWSDGDAGVNSRSNKDAEGAGEGEEKALTCLRYFSRAVYALDIRESSKIVDTSTPHSEKFSKGVFFEVHPKVTETIMDTTSFRQPPPLRHACRCVIRRAVSGARRENIPTALKALPVPTIIQQFLDLRF